MSKRKQYSPEFKREAVELARRSGTSCRQIAQEIGVAPSLLNRWVREARAAEKPFPGTGNPRDEELARLKRELARVTKERDFLGYPDYLVGMRERKVADKLNPQRISWLMAR